VTGLACPLFVTAAGATTNWVNDAPSDPTTGPFDGETVPVDGVDNGTGPVDILECVADRVPADGSALDRSWCDGDNVVTGLPVNPSTGSYSGYFVFDIAFTPSASGTPADCSQSGTCELVADANPPGDVAAAMPLKGVQGCNGAFNGNPAGSLAKTTSPAGAANPTAADIPVVAPGSTIAVTLTWNSGDFTGATSEVSDCIQIDGADRTDLATQQKPGPTPGPTSTSWSTSYTIPPTTAVGSVICDRGRVSGTPTGADPTTQKSNEVCFQVGPAAATPEFPWPLAGGVAAVGLLGGYTLRRHRSSGRRALAP